MLSVKGLENLKRFIFILLFVLLHYFLIRNAILISRDVLSGDFSGEKTVPAPQYGFLRIPNSSLVKENKAHDLLAGDFAQIYFPLKGPEGLKDNYISGVNDPWARPSRIAPLLHYLCAKTYCQLKYGPASLVHLYLQLALFYMAFIAAFVNLKIVRYLPLAILLVNTGLFLTSAGLAWFERGQFSLYVAMAYLFIIMGILKNKPIYFLLGGLFAFIKWTSLPTIFVMIAVYILASRSFQGLRSKVLIVSPFPAVILLLLSFFPVEGYYFVQGLLLQEAFIPPGGLSLVQLIPVTYAKLLPVALIVLGIPYIRKYGENFAEYMPFFSGAGILMLTYPSVAFEYSVSTLFGLIPLILYWNEYRGIPDGFTVRTVMKYIFFGFLMVASCSPFLVQIFKNNYITFWLYGLVSAVLLLIPWIRSFNGTKQSPTLQHIQ